MPACISHLQPPITHLCSMTTAPIANPVVGVETAQKLGLTVEEFEMILQKLGREPNFTEVSIFSVMWSEHCSYKNSILQLKTLPRDSERMLAKAGEENAGLVDIGDGLACSFKIESHNHPSALEPFQGAATGVGGINRDIFTMGARPIAQLNSLRFGDPSDARTRWHVRGVVAGIAHYGNAFGIPTVGGEVYFDPCYSINPLVNAFSAGIVEHGKVARAIAEGPGNPVFIVGSATGKDGIHGATFASEDITDKSTEKLPAVQVGDPFMEKLLLEATLEVIGSGAVVGIQDMGAAGIICSTSEMSAKGEVGMQVWLDKVPTRQQGMQPFEILLSESQERMLIVVHKGREAEVQAIFDKWDLSCAEIGVVTDTGRLEFFMAGQKVADVPAEELVLGGGAPVYVREQREPAYYQEYKAFDPNQVAVPAAEELPRIARRLLASPNLCSRRWVARQYDSMVGAANLSTNLPADAAVVQIKGQDKAIVVSVDCNGRYVKADPEIGASIAVAEAARNIVCAGGEPLAVTNCLNFGNPYLPEVYWQFAGAIRGMGKACLAFGTPVTGGNVSFYNQSNPKGEKAGIEQAVFPTPTIGMLGLMEGLDRQTGLGFTAEGDSLYLIGPETDDIAQSEYLVRIHGTYASPAPYFDLEIEKRVQKLVYDLITEKRIASAHDVSDGGLFQCLAESALTSGIGFQVGLNPALRADACLFGEGQSRVVVSCKPEQAAALEAQVKASGLSLRTLGTTGGTELVVDGSFYLSLAEARALHEGTLPGLLD